MLLALLDARPHVTVGDLYALSRYLFNLSNAVKQVHGAPAAPQPSHHSFMPHGIDVRVSTQSMPWS